MNPPRFVHPSDDVAVSCLRKGYEDHPINCVDWHQAGDFCSWVGGRLLSESEWEYVARGRGRKVIFPWGDETPTCDYAVIYEYIVEEPGLGAGCGTLRTWPVCSKTAGNTPENICDMAGSIREWVQDLYHADYSEAPVDGSAQENDSPDYIGRVARGGDFREAGDGLRNGLRTSFASDRKALFSGIRCAR